MCIRDRIAIMFPMIISVDEVKKIKEMIRLVQEELTEEGVERCV